MESNKHVAFQLPQLNSTYNEEQEIQKMDAFADATEGKLKTTEGVKFVEYDQYGFVKDGTDHSQYIATDEAIATDIIVYPPPRKMKAEPKVFMDVDKDVADMNEDELEIYKHLMSDNHTDSNLDENFVSIANNGVPAYVINEMEMSRIKTESEKKVEKPKSILKQSVPKPKVMANNITDEKLQNILKQYRDEESEHPKGKTLEEMKGLLDNLMDEDYEDEEEISDERNSDESKSQSDSEEKEEEVRPVTDPILIQRILENHEDIEQPEEKEKLTTIKEEAQKTVVPVQRTLNIVDDAPKKERKIKKEKKKAEAKEDDSKEIKRTQKEEKRERRKQKKLLKLAFRKEKIKAKDVYIKANGIKPGVSVHNIE